MNLSDIAVVQEPQQVQDHGHQGMFDLLADCQVLIAGGMGQSAYAQAEAQGLEIYLSGEEEIPQALAAYLAGTLQSDTRRVHAHHDHHHHA
ncbi:MAG: NifB/NifX family molybdenum-iron cluster-binding protein [Chloroflexota bacterium]